MWYLGGVILIAALCYNWCMIENDMVWYIRHNDYSTKRTIKELARLKTFGSLASTGSTQEYASPRNHMP